MSLVYFSTCFLGVLFYKSIVFSQNTPGDIQQYESTYDSILNIKKAYSDRDYAFLISLFPDNMEQFTEIYGYDDTSGKKPLYDDAFEHIKYFFNEVTNEYIDTLFAKAIGIAINGRWDADAVNYFQDEFIMVIKKYPKQFLSVISSKTVEESSTVWYFLFDGPHPSRTKECYEDIYNLIKPLSNVQADLLRQQFEVLLKDEKYQD
jgi:hypothetical protein